MPSPAPRTDPRADALQPWYHDFSGLGLDTGSVPSGFLARLAARLAQRCARVLPGSLGRGLYQRASDLRASAHRVNQSHKEAVLVPFLEDALDRLGEGPSCLDLFCSDGYYSCLIANLRPKAAVLGVDRSESDLERARLASRLLEARNVRFLQDDVLSFVRRSHEPAELVLCAGGLYHLSDPRPLLGDLRRTCTRFLVLQSVVSLDNENPEYFESPAPGWSHGCRFSHDRLAGWLRESGWKVERSDRNELTGNSRLSDRGSSYFLCEAP